MALAVRFNPWAAMIDAAVDAAPPIPVTLPPGPPVALRSTRRKPAALSLKLSEELARPPIPDPDALAALPPRAFWRSVSVPVVSPLTASVRIAEPAAPVFGLFTAFPAAPPVRF